MKLFFVLMLGIQFCLTIASSADGSNMTAFDANGVTFHLYRTNTKNSPYQLFTDNKANLAGANFNPQLDTIMYIHGYQSGYLKAQTQTIKEAVLNTSNANVILVDYTPYNQPYLYLYQNAKSIGKACASLINFLISHGKLQISKFVIAGHSFGAHISSFTANNINNKVPLIIGLDPAGPLFRLAKPENRLSVNDATFVDCIHTSPVLGIHESICTVNYFVNGGSLQPSCSAAGDNELLFGVCSHQTAVDYYANTLKNPKAYPASICLSDFGAKNDQFCLKTLGAYMHCSLKNRPLPGSYYVTVPTN